MRSLTTREKWMLGGCFAVIFLAANGFAARYIVKNLKGSSGQVSALDSQIKDAEMWLVDAEKADVRERWLDETMPRAEGGRLTKELGDLLQELQDQLFERKIKIEQQSMQEVLQENFYSEAAVRLTIRGDQAQVIEWLTELQSPEKFVVIKSLELKIDGNSKEIEPQSICQITVARWFSPDSGTDEPPAEESEEAEPLTRESSGTEEEAEEKG